MEDSIREKYVISLDALHACKKALLDAIEEAKKVVENLEMLSELLQSEVILPKEDPNGHAKTKE